MLFQNIAPCLCTFLEVNNPYSFLNQARPGHWLARAWFLKIDPGWIVGMRVRVCVHVCVCVSVAEAINN